MIEGKSVYDCIAEEMDGVDLQDLPDDQEFAKEMAKGGKEICMEGADILTVISEYTRYVCNRTYGVIKPTA